MIKKIVTVTLLPALIIMVILLLVGLFVPDSVLRKLDRQDDSLQTQTPTSGATVPSTSTAATTVAANGQTTAAAQTAPAGSTAPPTTTPPTANGTQPAPTSPSSPAPTQPAPTPSTPTPPPVAPPPAPACGAGGTCHLADIQAHASANDCWTAINANGSGMKAYKIPSSFLTSHASKQGISGMLCGKQYTSNLRSRVGDHNTGKTINSQTYDQAIGTASWYLGPYN